MKKLVSKFLSGVALLTILVGTVVVIPATSLAQRGSPAPDPVTVTPTEETASSSKPEFVPLTNLPGLTNVADSESLAGLLNQIYRLCIGAAAVIAVLQIMRAGAMHMFNKGSLSQSQNVRSLIQNSVLGLLLVLSPAIVFGIINPAILNINLDFSALKPNPLEDVPLDVGGGAASTSTPSATPGATDSPQGRPAAPQPSTSALLKTEYEWRFELRNQNGGLVSSIPGQEWPARGQGLWGARYPNQQACKEVQDAFTIWVRDERRGWTIDTSICSCLKPRGEYPQCSK